MALETLRWSCNETIREIGSACVISVVGWTVAAKVGTIGASHMPVFADKIVGFKPHQTHQIFEVVHLVGVHAHLTLTVGFVGAIFSHHHLMANRAFLSKR